MGGVVGNLFGGGSGPSAGGQGGVTDIKNSLNEQANELLVGLGPTREAREQQVQGFTQALAEQAAGRGPSLAQAQMQAAMDRNLAQQMAAVKANRAVNPALAQRQVMNAAGQQQQQTAQASAMARMQEQAQARNQFANFLGQQQELSTKARGAALGGASAAANINAANQARADRMGTELLNAGGQAAMMIAQSDKNMKKNIKPVKMADGGMIFGKMVQGMSSKPKDKNEGKILDIAGGQQYDDGNAIESASNFGAGLGKLFQKPPTESTAGRGPGAMLMMQEGGVVPGKAQVKGDSEKNDKVPALLSPGEIVVPRTVVQKGPDHVKNFAQALYEGGKVKKMNNGGVVEDTPEEIEYKRTVIGSDYDSSDSAATHDSIMRAEQKAAKEKEGWRPENFYKGGKVEKPLDLDKLQAYEYEYKDTSLPGTAPGKQVSVMAQDLEKAGPAGKAMVHDTPHGKMVNYGQGFGAILAAQAELNDRLNKIESKYGKKK